MIADANSSGEKTLRRFVVLCTILLLATATVSGSAFAADTQQYSCQQVAIVQTQNSVQTNVATVNNGEQSNSNTQRQQARVGQRSEQLQHTDHTVAGTSYTPCSALGVTVVQTQNSVQVNVAVMNNGEQTNMNTQRQTAIIEQDSDQRSTVVQTQNSVQVNVAVMNNGEQTNMNTQRQTVATV